LAFYRWRFEWWRLRKKKGLRKWAFWSGLGTFRGYGCRRRTWGEKKLQLQLIDCIFNYKRVVWRREE
jgi:hypothetical protein